MFESIDGKLTTIDDIKLVSLPRVDLERGSITAINSGVNIEFEIKRVYYLYDVPNRSDRGAHAHMRLHQLVMAATGSFEVQFYDSKENKSFLLNQPDEGLLVPPGLWRDLKEFSGGSVCLVLASREFEESDYIRNLLEFEVYKNI
jgi:dTDP-4-dehydrorhamnose 3,5-epimerase-like enzyme